MHQKLIYRALLFSLSVAFCSQASQRDEIGEYTLSESRRPANLKITANYINHKLIMTKCEKPANKEYTVTLNDTIIAQKIKRPANKEKWGPVSSWKKFPFKMTEDFVTQNTLNKQCNLPNNFNQQQLIIKQQNPSPTDPVDLENMKKKIDENKVIISRININANKNNAGYVGSFKNDIEQIKHNDFLFVELCRNKCDSSIDSIIHAAWFSWLINTAIGLPGIAQKIKIGLTHADFSVKSMQVFESISKNSTTIGCINFLKDYKKQYVCKEIDILKASQEDLLYLVANSIVHLTCDNNYRLGSNSEYADLFIHTKNLKTNNKYAFVLIIQHKDNFIIQCLVNKIENGIEIVTDQKISDDCKKFIKNILGDDAKTQNFLEKETIRLEQENTKNSQCAQQILKNLGIDKKLIEELIKIPVQEIPVENPQIINLNVGVPVTATKTVTLENDISYWPKLSTIINLAMKYKKTAAVISIMGMIGVASLIKNGAGGLFALGIVGVLGLWTIMSRKKT